MGSVSTKEGRDSICTSRSAAEQGGGLPICRDSEDLRLEHSESSASCSAEIRAPEACCMREKVVPEPSSTK